jgi:TatD DNase family protein
LLQEQKAERVVMHCFSGKWKLVERVVANDWFVTIPTSVISSEHFQRIAREIPLKNLFCETDAPYLHPDKGWPNEPSLVVRAYQKLSEIKGIPLEDVKAMLARNYERVFVN